MGARSIVIAGASGVVGRHLVARARADGFEVRTLTRAANGAPRDPSASPWDPAAAAAGEPAALDALARALEGVDVLVNLAGATLADGRLTTAHKRRVLHSRLDATRALLRAHTRCAAPPPVWINASATGYYGDTGEAEVDDDHPRGAGFLAAVCERWEEAAAEVTGRARLVIARIGLVLAEDAPAWQKLLRPIKWGVGGPLGSGRQWWAWIDGDDLARALLFLADHPEGSGAFNLTAPHPVRQADLAWETALLVGRRALLPTPAFALRAAIGEVADELILPSCRALPRRLQALGFKFERENIGRELGHLLA